MSEAIKAAEKALNAAHFAELHRALEGQATTTEPVKAQHPQPPPSKILQFPLPFGDETRAAANPLVRSALFAAIKGKDRQLLNDCEIATVEGWKMIFSGEQFNQDDKDTLMQLVFMMKHKPIGEYVTIPAHAILKGLGRDVGGKAHQALKEEIERLVKGTLKLEGKQYDYIGHLIDDAAQDKTSKYWVIRFNPRFAPLFADDSYTLIDWSQRKKLKGKDLARWLQLELATHAVPFARSVDYYREKSGSRVARLCDFRKALIRALDNLKTSGDIAKWLIDATDLVTIERTPSASQKKHIIKKSNRKPSKT